MIGRLNPWLFAVVPICCLSAQAEAAPQGRSVATGSHIRVICHFDNAKIAQQALRTAQKAWTEAAGLFGVNDAALSEPAVIHLFRRAEEYQAAESRLANGRFQHNLAFSSRGSGAAYVAIQPPCTDRTLAAVGLPALTLRQIAHETAHLASFDAPADGRPRAQWISEGAASFVAELTMADLFDTPVAESVPFTATDMHRAQDLLHSGELPQVRRILEDDDGSLRFYERYAVQWLFFRFLMTDARGEWDSSAANPVLSPQATPTAAATRLMNWAPVNTDALDEAFKQYVGSRAPQWQEQSRSLAVRGDTWTQIAFADTDAVAWRAKPAGAVSYRISGTLEFLPNSARQTKLLLGRDRRGHVVVSFRAEAGVAIQRYRTADRKTTMLAVSGEGDIRLAQRVSFDVVVAPGNLRILIDGKPCLTVNPGDAAMAGQWGVGATAGSAGLWRHVRIRSED